VSTVTLDITGMTCAVCAGRVEKALAAVEGVEKAQVNLALEKADVTLAGGGSPEAVVAAVDATGFGAHLRSERAADRRAEEEEIAAMRRADERRTLLRFTISAAFTVPLLIGVLPAMTGLGAALIGPWTQFALATPVMVVAGSRFYREAFAAVRGGAANMAVLVSLGTSVAYVYSAWRVFAGGAQGHTYFEAAAVVLTLVLLGKYLEARAKSDASAALTVLGSLQPDTAERISAAGVETVSVDLLNMGDRLLIRPGARVPADATVVSGHSSLDEALLTGESLPVAKDVGDPVITGTVNGDGALEVTVDAVGADTRLARITRLVEAAQSGTAPVQRLVDQISAVFVPVILVLAALTFAGWLTVGAGFEAAMVAAVSVLVIACPCALGLATPTALVAGTGAAARAGVLIRDIETLERARAVSTVAFDKTGTLTLGQPAVTDIVAAEGVSDDDVIAIAAALEHASEHPLAKAVRRRAEEAGLALAAVSGVTADRGRGLTGEIGGESALVGTAEMMVEHGIDVAAVKSQAADLENQARTLAFVARKGRLLGLLGFADTLRPEAIEAIAALGDDGMKTLMLTGDLAAVADKVAGDLDIDDVRARLSPEDKLRVLGDLQTTGGQIAFVGDGLNDGPALAAADLGIAMSGGTDVAREAAALTLMRPDLRLVPAALEIARKTRRTILQNLIWAFGYNVIGVPLAAFGFLSPAFAGAAMALSSVSVVTNAAWLARWRPKFQTAAKADSSG
jgi:Cu+-exporting ATPase